MALLGFRSMDDMIGLRRPPEHAPRHRALEGARPRLSAIMLKEPFVPGPRRRVEAQDHGLGQALDDGLLDAVPRGHRPADAGVGHARRAQRQSRRRHDARLRGDQGVGRRRAARRHHPHRTAPARPARASARSCRAASRCACEGDANDYVGKGLSGGRLSSCRRAGDASPPRTTSSSATSRSTARPAARPSSAALPGERFAVRNSGAHRRGRRASATTAAST